MKFICILISFFLVSCASIDKTQPEIVSYKDYSNQNNVNNFIYINRLENWSFTDSILQGMPVFEFKEQDAILRGFEVQYDYHPHPLDWLHIGQSLSYVTAHFVGATNTEQLSHILASENVEITQECLDIINKAHKEVPMPF